MASSTKKKNRHKLRVINNVKSILNNITICNVFVHNKDSDKPSWTNSMVFRKDKPIKVPQSLAWHIDNIRTKWDVMCGVFCRTQQGEHYALYFNYRASTPCLSFDVSEIAQKCCYKLFVDAPNLQKLVPFFLAVPRTDDEVIDLTLAFRTAHHYKAFDKVGTNFEFNVNKPYKAYCEGEWFEVPINWELCQFVDLDLEEIKGIQLELITDKDGNKIIKGKSND